MHSVEFIFVVFWGRWISLIVFCEVRWGGWCDGLVVMDGWMELLGPLLGLVVDTIDKSVNTSPLDCFCSGILISFPVSQPIPFSQTWISPKLRWPLSRNKMKGGTSTGELVKVTYDIDISFNHHKKEISLDVKLSKNSPRCACRGWVWRLNFFKFLNNE